MGSRCSGQNIYGVITAVWCVVCIFAPTTRFDISIWKFLRHELSVVLRPSPYVTTIGKFPCSACNHNPLVSFVPAAIRISKVAEIVWWNDYTEVIVRMRMSCNACVEVESSWKERLNYLAKLSKLTTCGMVTWWCEGCPWVPPTLFLRLAFLISTTTFFITTAWYDVQRLQSKTYAVSRGFQIYCLSFSTSVYFACYSKIPACSIPESSLQISMKAVTSSKAGNEKAELDDFLRDEPTDATDY